MAEQNYEKSSVIEAKDDPEYIRGRVAEKAAEYFAAGYNCAEAVLIALSLHWKIENEAIPKIATCFGAGIGRRGSVCGAVTGCIIALGLKMGRKDCADYDRKEKAYVLALEFYRGFEKQLGTAICYELTGCDLTTLEGKKKYASSGLNKYRCEKLVKEAVKNLLAIADAESGK